MYPWMTAHLKKYVFILKNLIETNDKIIQRKRSKGASDSSDEEAPKKKKSKKEKKEKKDKKKDKKKE